MKQTCINKQRPWPFSASFPVPKLDFFKAEEWVLSRVDRPHFLLSANLFSHQNLLCTALIQETSLCIKVCAGPITVLMISYEDSGICQGQSKVHVILLFKKKFKVI